MGANPGDNQQHDVGRGYGERDFQNLAGAAGAMGVDVHFSSLRAGRVGFKSGRQAAGVEREKQVPHGAQNAPFGMTVLKCHAWLMTGG